MENGYALSKQDVETLREVVRIVRSNPQLLKNRSSSISTARDVEDHQAPEVYIAYPQESSGIPELAHVGSVSGSGTTMVAPRDMPGKARCDIFKITRDDQGNPVLVPIQKSVTVYNLTTSQLDQDWLVVVRDKSGNWLATTGGGGGGGTIQFTILSADCETGCVEAVVTVLGAGESSVEVGDTVNVYDGLGCFFNVREDLLIGLNGIAHRFQGDDPCTVYDSESTHWRVAALCCSVGC